jgi:regulation of enolase protein 1 (concanavalin A-like superfamily)
MRKKELARIADEEQRTVASTQPFIALPDISSKPEERETPKEPTPPTKQKEEAPTAKTTPSPAATTPAPKPAPEPTTTPAPPAEASKTLTQPATPKAAPPAVALATNATKPEIADAVIGGIGAWFDPDKDSQYRSDGAGVTITIPGTAHVNSLQIRKTNAPRILREVKGDFVAQVRIPDRIQPGSQPLEGFPIAFQGAGLLLWQDEKNYVRLERAAASSPDRPLSHQVLLESLRDGKPGKPEYLQIREKPIILRMERKGSDINCSYSADGKTWIPVKNAALGFNTTVGVGVSAGNLSPKSFSARFDNFTLDAGGGKTGKSRTP